jgi:DNA adenine methylase
MTALTPPLKWHGGKHFLSSRLVAMMPPHAHYVEPFAGGLAVLLAKSPEGVSEVVNDLDGGLTNFWRVLRDEASFSQFCRLAQAIPFSEAEWEDAETGLTDPDPVRQAVAFFVRCRQSLAGRMDAFAPLSRTRTRRGMNEQASAWAAAVDGLPAVHARLRRVAVLRRDAVAAIKSQDGPDTLFYCDPPYFPGSRAAPAIYRCEMSGEDHVRLLKALARIEGKFLLSGYGNPVYARAAEKWGWTCRRFDLPNHAAGGETKRRMEECVWTNF